MEELKRLLTQADDEYLTGLSNKGMVKRAYKDLEQDSPEISWDGEEALVKWKDADCRIKAPEHVPPPDCRHALPEAGDSKSVRAG